MMDPERWKRVDDLLQSALRLSSSERNAFLRKACGGDADLERDVQSLLISQREIGDFLERPALEVAAEQMAAEEESNASAFDARAGQTIGYYRLVEPLGAGGMGEVWRAEQSEPLRRTVALKLIKPGMDTKTVIARFESERQALAMMDHPNIAKVFDAGATPTGRPYFAMEHVPGIAITDYCDQHRLTLKERLLLFLQVCDGVLHAHQKAIIHRDLKFSNILVAEVDGKPVPKIIDFGLAKATAGNLTENSMLTVAGLMLGTPAYMSPEQAATYDTSVDTRTDVYSLGVILFELLAGALPFAPQDFRQPGVEAMLRGIREAEVPRPSVKFLSLGTAANEIAARRKEDAGSLVRHLQDDLDWIAMKAMEKDRDRRYASPSELAADIRRHLEDQPVLAGPPGAAYRARKFVRRHRFGVSAAAAAATLVIAFATTMVVQARRVARERDRAEREAATSKRVSDFMVSMFKVSEPNEARGRSITAREILDRASKQIDTDLKQEPELQANLMDVMGIVYTRLGLLQEGRPLLEKSVELRRHALGNENAATLTSRYHLAWLLYQQGQFAEAEQLFRAILESRKRVLGENDPDTLTTMDGLACELDDYGQHAEAETLERTALTARLRVLGPANLDTLDSMNNLAGILTNENKYDEAGKLYAETIEATERALGSNAPTALWARSNLAWNLHQQGRDAESEKLYREAIERERLVFGPEHKNTLLSMNNLAEVLTQEKKYAEAEALQREALEIQRRTLGPNHQQVGEAIYSLAVLAALQQRREEALSLLSEAIAHGLSPDTKRQVNQDSRLAFLHGDPRFSAIVTQLRTEAQGAIER